MTSRRWVVTTSSNRSLSEIEKKLSKAGFVVDQVLDEIGCINGTASDEVASKLRDITGVTDVSPETPIDIGPPDSPETW
jgi:hypothetical protein